MSSIKKTIESKSNGILNIYITAGYPTLNATVPILHQLIDAGVDLIEIGMPYSDPLADGLTIQQSSQAALKNGMNIQLLFKQLEGLKGIPNKVPIILMGYLNPVLQYGIENFLESCKKVGVAGVILPDLPLWEYKTHYQKLFNQYGIENIFLITAQTTVERIREIDAVSNSFIYLVSSATTTGGTTGFGQEHTDYFARIAAMQLKNPTLIGFGISTQESYQTACSYSNGAIVGSAFIRMLQQSENLNLDIRNFVQKLRGTRLLSEK